MSKGLGRIERAILALLARARCHQDTAFGLATNIELGLWNGEDWPLDFKPSLSSSRSVDRALRLLERKGLVTRIKQPFPSYGERGRRCDGWLLAAEAAEWHAHNRRTQPKAPSKPSGQKTGLSDEDLAMIAEKVRGMRGG
jgi:hypothetical protein